MNDEKFQNLKADFMIFDDPLCPRPRGSHSESLKKLNASGKHLVKHLEKLGIKQRNARDYVSTMISTGVYNVTVASKIREGLELEEAHDFGAAAMAQVKRCGRGLSLPVDLAQFVLDNGGSLKTLKKDFDDIIYASRCAHAAMPIEILQQLAAIQARRAQEMIDLMNKGVEVDA